MDVNHIEASLCFPTFPRFCGQTFTEAKDKELALLCVKAYNDYQVEEWCAGTGGRLIPLIIVPLWDAAAGRRGGAAQRRARRAGRVLQRDPGLPRACPSIHDPDNYWDPFFRACDETSTVVNMHIGSSLEDAVDVGRRPGRRRLVADPHQRRAFDDRLPPVAASSSGSPT